MKARIILLIATALSCFLENPVTAQQKYQMQPVSIQTRWAKEVSPDNALKEYPRPQMVRRQWTNLNGLWDYAITPKDSSVPLKSEGQILVPYPLESALSGVKKSLKPDQNLWYMRKIMTPSKANGNHIILHFGAIDYDATIYIDGILVGRHEGGYTEFSFDITKFLTKVKHDLFVKVYDPSERGVGPHGKQMLKPGSIYYTPSSGIWQTVWMETVPAEYITSLVLTPDIDKAVINVTVNSASDLPIELNVEGSIIKGESNKQVSVPIKDMKLWSPNNPYLYDLKVKLGRDEVQSYFGMRKISIAKDEEGVDRIFLNNKPYFNLGTLDQGFWPDGLYTAPTDEALAFDIKAIKAMGFNTIRKHIKVEPARWYYHADKIGMLVWQDMVNPNQGLPKGSKAVFEKQSMETIQQLHNCPSITTWVLFNEKWGQYDQARLTKWLKEADPSRLVNGHSGELLYVDEKLRSPAPNAYVNSDMTDVHSYPDPMMSIKQDGKAQVLGEFGGIGVFVGNHQWNPEAAWGYIQEKPAALKFKYEILNKKLLNLKQAGLSASVYTQPFDVESEQNGLMTYDREIIKIPFSELRKMHEDLNCNLEKIPVVTAKDADLTDPELIYLQLLQKYKQKADKDNSVLYNLILMAKAFNDVNSLKFLIEDYINGLKSPYSSEELNRVVKLTKSSDDPGFSFLLLNSKAVNNILGENVADGRILELIDNEISKIIRSNNSIPDWKSINELMTSKYGRLGTEGYLKALVVASFYNTTLNGKAEYVINASKLMDFLELEYPGKAEIRVGGMSLNNYAWAAFESISDTIFLNRALKWSKYSIEEWPDNYQRIDTYANLLYKLGFTSDAIEWETKAMNLMPEKERYRYKATIDKMKKGIKTWLDIKQRSSL